MGSVSSFEDLDAKATVELPGNSRNRAGAAWGTFRSLLEYRREREGTHFVAVNPRGTTKECASCGVSTEKPLWVRERSCPLTGCQTSSNNVVEAGSPGAQGRFAPVRVVSATVGPALPSSASRQVSGRG